MVLVCVLWWKWAWLAVRAAVHSHHRPLSDDQAIDASRGTYRGGGTLREVNGMHRRYDEPGSSVSVVTGERAGRPDNGD